MTVETQVTTVTALGNGVATSFSFSPVVLTVDTDLEVYLVNSSGVQTLLTEGAGAAQYTVVPLTAWPCTGSVSYPGSGGTVLPTGSSLVMNRVVVIEQTMALTNQGGYFPDTQEAAFDYLTMICLQLQEQLDRAVLVPISDTVSVTTLQADIIALGAIITGLSAIAADLTNINAVAADLTALNALAADLTNVNAVEAALAAINAVSADLTNINAVAADLTNIDACAADLTAINAAPTAATDAAASATSAASLAAGVTDTSATSLTIGTGAQTATVSAGKQFAAGQFVTLVSRAGNTNYMHGQVTSYSGTTLIVNVLDVGGSGTKTDWNVSISGSQGAVGPAGATGPAGGTMIEVTIGTNQSLGAGQTLNFYEVTAALTLTIANSTLLSTQWQNLVDARGGAVTVTPYSTDKINNGTAGVSVVIPQGQYATLTTDAAGNLYVTMSPDLGSTFLVASYNLSDLNNAATARTNLGLATVAATGAYADLTGAPTTSSSIEFVIDGGGSALTTGVKGYIEVPFNATITQSTLLADQSGSVTLDIWKTTYASFDAGSTHPVIGDSITASAEPAIATATKNQDATLTGWTTALTKGDILAFDVKVAATSITRCTISLQIVRA